MLNQTIKGQSDQESEPKTLITNNDMVIYIDVNNIWLVYMKKVKLPSRVFLHCQVCLINHQTADVIINNEYILQRIALTPKISQNR